MRQCLFFIGDRRTRIEFDIDGDVGERLALTSRFEPRRDLDVLSLPTSDEVADAIEDRVTSHLAEYGARLQYIRYRHSVDLVTIGQLGRFAVSIFEDDTGLQPRPSQGNDE